MTPERIEKIKSRVNYGASDNKESISIEVLIAILEELKTLNNKKKNG